MPESPSLNVLKAARDRLLAEPGGDGSLADQFRDAIWAYLDALCQHPHGKSLLTEYGEFVRNSTAAGTPYADAWNPGSTQLR